jgi:diadenosine tetraphosphatase ApaH/serine/threonine PP2A family protein phosphatase
MELDGGLRYLIIADVHANLEALETVLNAAAGLWDRVLVLGDLVGYGASPNEVVDAIRALNPAAIIRGNHDKAACGLEDGSNFNHVARAAATWTSEVLTPDNRTYLRELPTGPITIDERVEICHGAPFDEDHYIFDADDALRALATASRPVCLFAHTHLPVVFHYENEMFDGYVPDVSDRHPVVLQSDAQYLVNVGSVGQPRDGDPRAAYGIYDDEQSTLFMYRVPYPVDGAQRRILAAGLPASLANRLAVGR